MAWILFVLAIPLLFLHVDYQRGLDVGVLSTTVTFRFSDLVVIALATTALVASRGQLERVARSAAPLWIALAAFAAVVLAWSLLPLALSADYGVAPHVVTAVKFVEYMAIAPALAVLVRRPAQLAWIAVPMVAWSAVASAVGLAQFAGVRIFEWGDAWWRQGSFLGQSDFAALSGAALVVAAASIVLTPPGRLFGRLTLPAAVSGIVGLVIAGAGAGAVGAAAATLAVVAVSPGALTRPRRAHALALALAAVAFVGVLTMRSRDIGQFARFLGVAQATTPEPDSHVESYAQRTVLSYIGLRIFLGSPLVGVGWQGSAEPENFEPELPAARRRFPDQPELAFPSERRRYGVQNAYVQALADFGIAGTAVAAALFVAALAAAARAARSAAAPAAWAGAVGLGWLLLVLGLWVAQGLVAGTPLAALTWIAVGTAAAAWRLRTAADA